MSDLSITEVLQKTELERLRAETELFRVNAEAVVANIEIAKRRMTLEEKESEAKIAEWGKTV